MLASNGAWECDVTLRCLLGNIGSEQICFCCSQTRTSAVAAECSYLLFYWSYIIMGSAAALRTGHRGDDGRTCSAEVSVYETRDQTHPASCVITNSLRDFLEAQSFVFLFFFFYLLLLFLSSLICLLCGCLTLLIFQ